jgi:hypothetical protein
VQTVERKERGIAIARHTWPRALKSLGRRFAYLSSESPYLEYQMHEAAFEHE